MKRDHTATVYIFQEDKVLLHPHAKLQKWLPPGGHLEKEETPQEAARREVLEETGLKVAFLTDDPFSIDEPHAKNLEKPFLHLLENIPAYQDIPPHQHIDTIFLAKPLSEDATPLPPFQWVTLLEAQKLELFSDTRKILSHLLLEGGLKRYRFTYQRLCVLSPPGGACS